MRAPHAISALALVTALIAGGGCARLGVVGLEQRSAASVELTIASQAAAMHPQPCSRCKNQ